MILDISAEITAIAGIQSDLATKLMPGNTITSAQAASLGQVVAQLRDVTRLAIARLPAVAIDPEPRPVYDPVTHIEQDNEAQFDHMQES